MAAALKIFVIAGEASGDALGAELIAGLRRHADIEISGVGGVLMQEAGLRSLFDISDISVMGLYEILPKIPVLLRRIRQTAAEIARSRPDIVITIDSPDFCLRVIKRVRARLPKIRVVHYVAPSIWAWRPERAEKMVPLVDHVLALLPFEPELIARPGMSCDFVGHPIAAKPLPDMASRATSDARRRHLVLLPGSRRAEIARMLPIWMDVLRGVRDRGIAFTVTVPTVALTDRFVRQGFEKSGFDVVFLSQSEGDQWAEAKKSAFENADLALVTSGTVSLEVAHALCPQIVAYKTGRATTRLIKRLAQIDTASLVNIITKKHIIPEFLFERARPELIVDAVIKLLSDVDAQNEQRAACREAMEKLQPPEEDAAAHAVLRFLRADAEAGEIAR